jgi:hypothetical protein
LTFRLSRLNVFVALGTLTIILIFLTSMLIAFTPLREYIPGYTNVSLQKKLYELQIKTDSIEKDLEKKTLFIANLRNIINGKDLTTDLPIVKDTLKKYTNIRINLLKILFSDLKLKIRGNITCSAPKTPRMVL